MAPTKKCIRPSLSPPSALMSVMEALEHVDLQERARRCPRGFAEPLLLAPLPLYALRIRAPYSRSRQTVIVAAMSSLVSPARALLPSVEGRSVFGARASLSLRAGCPGGGRSRRSPSRLQSAPPVELGPALSSLESGRHVGGAPNTD